MTEETQIPAAETAVTDPAPTHPEPAAAGETDVTDQPGDATQA